MEKIVNLQMLISQPQSMPTDELVKLQSQVDHDIRERRFRDVTFYFNQLAKLETYPVNRLATEKYLSACREMRALKRGYIVDPLLDDIEALTGL